MHVTTLPYAAMGVDIEFNFFSTVVDASELIRQNNCKMSDKVYQGSDFDEKVRKQVEFYFSDSNLQSDRFLWKIYEANDGWVELKTILTFGRMRQYRPEDKVISALKKSEKLTLSQNEDMIRRKEPLKDFNDIKNNRKRNSIRLEGFPNDSTQEELEEFFNNKIVPNLNKEKEICSVRLIRNRAKKEFFGTVEVEFRTAEDADQVLNEFDMSYPSGILLNKDDVEEKDLLKKMSVLTYQEMKEGRKRFGVNEFTKRRNNFGDQRNNKRRTSRSRRESANSKDQSVSEDQPANADSSEAPETTEKSEADIPTDSK